MITHERLLELLTFDPETGKFHNRIKRSDKIIPGEEAGCYPADRRYAVIGIDGIRYYLHRLAWFYVHAEWPEGELDHRDNDGFNNRISNLRLATSNQNQHNTRIPKNNTSGVKGVCWDKKKGKWMASISINRKNKFIGYFSDIKIAERAIQQQRQLIHQEFYNHG